MTQPSPATWLDAFFGSGYKVVVNGTNVFPSRLKLDLEGVGFSIVDDPTNDQTIITFTNGQTTTRTTASFVMPAVSANVTIPVLSTSSLAPGLSVFVAGAGYLNVASVTDGTHFVAENPGAPGNATPGTTIATNALVIPSGPSSAGLPAGTGLVEVTGGAGSTIALGSTGDVLTMTGPSTAAFAAPASVVVKTTANFTQPAIGSSVAVAVTSSSGYAAGTWATVAGGGRYTVASVPDGTHLALVNRGGPGNASPGATILSGAVVSLAATEPVGVLNSALTPFSIRPVVNVLDPRFGADPTGTTDNVAAFTAAIAAAIATGSTMYIPAGTYLLSAELPISTTLHVVGDSDEYVILRATAPMRSVFWLQDSDNLISGLQFQCNLNAKYAILFSNAAQSVLDDVTVSGAISDPWRVQGYLTAAAITTGAQTGGGPALTVSQPDPLLNNIGGSTLRIKITTGGALGTATFQISQDGGTTYTGVDQILFAATAIAMMAPPVPSTDSGLRITAPSGTYVLGTTYDFSMVPGTTAANEGIRVRSNCSTLSCGMTYATAGLAGDYTGRLNLGTATGTATWTAGSPYVSIPGGNLLAKGARDGDFIRLPGAKFPFYNRVVPQQFCDVTAIACVLSDSLVAIDPGNPPTVSGSGSGYAIGVGTGAGFVDPHTGKENDQFTIEGGHYTACPIGFRDGALNCGSVNDAWFDDYAFAGCHYGTEFAD